MDSVKKTGKTVEEAVQNALLELSVTRDEVDIEIVDSGSKGILGIGSKPVVVNVKKKFIPDKIGIKFIKQITESMGLEVQVTSSLDAEGRLLLNLEGDNVGVLIGKHGKNLDSLQYLVSLVVNKNFENHVSVLLEAGGYRERRKETLESLAKNIAVKVKATGKPCYLEPMSAYERRIIHMALADDAEISTSSAGVGEDRHVVVDLLK